MSIARFATAAILAVICSACGPAAAPLGAEYDFAIARDTVVLQQTDSVVVAALTDLLDWRGDLVVADRIERNLKVYDVASGALKHVVGRTGQGPGEFMSVLGATVFPDGRLAVLDGLLSRVTVFDDPETVVLIFSLPGIFGRGVAAGAGGDVILPGRLVADGRIIGDSAVHRFNTAGKQVGAYFVLPAASRFAESNFNSMAAVVADSMILALQATTNVLLSHDLRDGTERFDSLGAGFYRAPQWTLKPGVSDSDVDAWIKTQMFAWTLRTLNSNTYVAGFEVWVDSVQDWQRRWVFGHPRHGPFAESAPTDAQPAFIRDSRLYSVRIAQDGIVELIVGAAPR